MLLGVFRHIIFYAPPCFAMIFSRTKLASSKKSISISESSFSSFLFLSALLFDKQTNKQASKMCLVYFKEYQTNKVWTRFIVWFIYAAINDYTGVCVPTSILVNFFPIFLIFGLINRTPSWLQPHLCQISIEPHPKSHFEK